MCRGTAPIRASGRAGSSRTGGNPPLEALDPAGGVTDAILEQVWRLPRGESHFVTVVVPEAFRKESILEQFRHPHELALKLRLLAEPGVVVADVPRDRRRVPADAEAADRPRARLGGQRRVDAGRQLRADARHRGYARRPLRLQRRGRPRAPRRLGSARPARGRSTSTRLRTATSARRSSATCAELTADEDTAVLVIMPELVVSGWRRLLHNQRALFVKRLLLFEPGVILASVPYQLLR